MNMSLQRKVTIEYEFIWLIFQNIKMKPIGKYLHKFLNINHLVHYKLTLWVCIYLKIMHVYYK